jgi:hypothetical protein
MSAVAFDSLHYAHQLEAAGMPRAQAEVIAQGLTSMFVHNFDSLVTKDYMDVRFSEQSVKMDFLATDLSTRMDAMDAKFDAKLGLLSAEIDGKLGKLYVMLGMIMAGVAVPIIQSFTIWLA